jgi:hypothetical protein
MLDEDLGDDSPSSTIAVNKLAKVTAVAEIKYQCIVNSVVSSPRSGVKQSGNMGTEGDSICEELLGG